MKILFLSDVPLKNPRSGSELVLNKQATYLSKAGNQIYSITRENNNSRYIKYENFEGINDACYSVNTKSILNSLLSIIKYPTKLFDKIAGETAFSVVIAHQPFTLFSLLCTGRISDIPLIYIYHSPSHLEYTISNKNGRNLLDIPHVAIRKLIERFCLKKSQKIMVLSRYMKEKIKEIHNIQPDRITINHGGCDLNQFRPIQNRDKIKKTLFLKEDKLHLLTIRNLEPRMGLDNLLRAVKSLKKYGLGIHLTIGGEGPEQEKLVRLINELNLQNEVTMTGFIPASRLSLYYGAADYFILPTRYLEGFGLVTTEALACGTPVLGTPVGGTKEILNGFDPNFIFKDTSAEAIAAGIENTIQVYSNKPKIYKNLRRKCRIYAEKNYSWQRHFNKINSECLKIAKLT
jgi:glycosyltransferase involved in cell wall biosynthesis